MSSHLLASDFGYVLKRIRTRKKLTRMQLAADAGMHLNGLSNLERGERSPTLQTVFLLAAALKIPPSELVAAVEARQAERPKKT